MVVKLLVMMLKPHELESIYDPCCGSGGMFVQSARFVGRHKRNPSSEISVYGEERVDETVRLCRMNMAVHGLAGDIKQGNSYYEDMHKCRGRFDYVMANPKWKISLQTHKYLNIP